MRPRPAVIEQLLLPGSVAAEIMAHARAALPHEACGLLAGSRSDGRATEFHPARNEHSSALRYSVDPDDLVRIVFTIEGAGADLLAIVHSHVGSSAVPSATDVREARYPDALQVIASLADPDAAPVLRLRAWRVGEGAPTEVPIVIG
ncbi:MAG: M67 family metallopeptidase [Chloroflexi bacterium]|nr:M67 family metallopeptidase [Chloroflexota bacterium]